jgi:Tfp pilus assembly protein PilX
MWNINHHLRAGNSARIRATRRGLASVLAMLFLILFSVLAIGFFASTTLSVQMAKNERSAADAMLAAESGLQFARFHLGTVDIPTNTVDSDLLTSCAAALSTRLNGTTNMGSNNVAVSNGEIHLPSATGWVNLDSAGTRRFRVTITQSGAFLVATVIGQATDPLISRSVRLKFQKAPRASAIFDYGVASRGKIVTAGSSRIVGQGDPARGSVLSTTFSDPTPVVVNGKEVSGDISIVNPDGIVSFSGASIGGSTNAADIIANHIHKGVQEPDFPDVDTSAYAAYAVNKYTGGKVLTNAYIPANMNPKFTGGTTIRGVLLIEAPNNVDFGGNVDLQGVIVVKNAATPDLVKNQISFTGSVTAKGVETLPESFGELRKLTGAFILANNFYVSFSGNFGTVNGHIIASKIKFWGNAAGTVKGSVINMHDVQMDVGGSSTVTIASTGTSNYPTGVTFGSKFAPLPDTYVELPME